MVWRGVDLQFFVVEVWEYDNVPMLGEVRHVQQLLSFFFYDMTTSHIALYNDARQAEPQI
jgi:hypothetical protein